jgi:hypothetical protein
MPHGVTQKIIERKQAILKLLEDGCRPTSYIIQQLELTHTEAFYALNKLAEDGYIKRAIFGRVAIWCLNEEHYNKMIRELLEVISKIVENRNLKYIYPSRLYKLILNDPYAYKLLSRYVQLNEINSSVRAFLNYLLAQLYGPPYYRGEKIVYLTERAVEAQKPKT